MLLLLLFNNEHTNIFELPKMAGDGFQCVHAGWFQAIGARGCLRAVVRGGDPAGLTPL